MAGGKRVVKWLGIGVAVVLGITVLAAGSAYGVSEYRLRKTYTVPAATLAIPTDTASIARGKHLFVTRGCADCHGANLGGTKFIDAPPMGVLYAANLTKGEGGLGRTYTDADWVRAIRHGVRKDGKSVLFMPSQEFTQMSDEDLALLIAYIKSMPAVDNVQPASTVGPLGRALFVAGQLPLLPAELIDHSASRPARVTPGRTAEYGGYLMKTCEGCHGQTLSGGKIPGTPPEFIPAANLTPDKATGLGAWTEADFKRALREGRRPDGRELNPQFMPWKNFAHFTDDEIAAMWMYLQTIPAKAHGNR